MRRMTQSDPFLTGLIADALRDYTGWEPGDDDQIGPAEHVAASLEQRLGADHYVIFSEDRWIVEHSLACRISGHMAECEYHQAIAEVYGHRLVIGRWRITEIDEMGMPSLERAPAVGGDDTPTEGSA